MAASGAYDVLVLVHDFPYRSLPSEVDDGQRGDRARSSPRPRDRPDILPVYVSLTSGEPPPETKALLDEAGGGAPLLRGAVRGVPGDRRGRALGGRAAGAPVERPMASGVAGARGRPDVLRSRPEPDAPGRTRRPVGAVGAREHGARRRPPGSPRPRPCQFPMPRPRWTSRDAWAGPVALKLDATGLAHKTRPRRRARSDCVGDDAVYAAALALLETGRRHGSTIRGLLVEPMAAPGSS